MVSGSNLIAGRRGRDVYRNRIATFANIDSALESNRGTGAVVERSNGLQTPVAAL